MGNRTIRCKICRQHFSLQEWQTNKICENEKCNCPGVRESMKLTQQVMEKMKAPPTVMISTYRVPSGDAETKGTDRYYYDCPKLMKIVVSPPGSRGGNKKK